MRMCRTFTGMCLVRRSLGPNGCGVKQRNRRFSQKRGERRQLFGSFGNRSSPAALATSDATYSSRRITRPDSNRTVMVDAIREDLFIVHPLIQWRR